MPAISFSHEKLGSLVVNAGPEEVAWEYKMNIARFPTYGGEVVQILSCYIENMSITGVVSSYKKAEEIYGFFGRYFVIATQGPEANADAEHHFEQTPMTMTYPERHWQFQIQPLQAPNFVFSLNTIAPRWTLEAHVVDEGLAGGEAFNELVYQKAEQELKESFGNPGEEFRKLTGVISPASADPALNPFVAPVTLKKTKNAKGETEEEKFTPRGASEITGDLGKEADYYSKLLPSYMESDFSSLVDVIGSKPIFGRATEVGAETPEEFIKIPPASSAKGKPNKKS